MPDLSNYKVFAQLFISFFLLIKSESLAARLPDASDALMDTYITKQLCSVNDGPEFSQALYQAAWNNEEDPYELAREACQIMAANVAQDFKRLDNNEESAEDIAVLKRLYEELKQHEKTGCNYREWIRLSAKFCLITGFIRYRKHSDQYEPLWRQEPDKNTPLTDFEKLPWEWIDATLAGQKNWVWGEKEGANSWAEFDDCGVDIDQFNLFKKILIRLTNCRSKHRFVFPSFQSLDLEYFVKTKPLNYRPVAVLLDDKVDADGYMMTRGMFFLHDCAHADAMNEEAKKDITTMKLGCAMIHQLYECKSDINRLEPNLFQAIELALFFGFHELDDYNFTELFTPPKLKYNNLTEWVFMTIMIRHYKNDIRDLEKSHGIVFEHPRCLHLSVLWLAKLHMECFKSKAPADFRNTIHLCCETFPCVVSRYEITISNMKPLEENDIDIVKGYYSSSLPLSKTFPFSKQNTDWLIKGL